MKTRWNVSTALLEDFAYTKQNVPVLSQLRISIKPILPQLFHPSPCLIHQSLGINAVRVPVGYWLAEEGMDLQDEYYANVKKGKRDDVEAEAKQTVDAPYPFTAGGLKYLDFAFDMGEK